MSKPVRPLPDELRAKVEALQSDPAWVERMARTQRVANRDPIAYVIVEEPLAPNTRAIVRLSQQGEYKRYAVMPRHTFDDDIILLVAHASSSYEMQYEDDHTPVEITIFADGRVEAASEKNGHVVVGKKYQGQITDRWSQSRAMLRALDAAPTMQARGFASGRVVYLPNADMKDATK